VAVIRFRKGFEDETIRNAAYRSKATNQATAESIVSPTVRIPCCYAQPSAGGLDIDKVRPSDNPRSAG
jgi:hypothetical protein